MTNNLELKIDGYTIGWSNTQQSISFKLNRSYHFQYGIIFTIIGVFGLTLTPFLSKDIFVNFTVNNIIIGLCLGGLVYGIYHMRNSVKSDITVIDLKESKVRLNNNKSYNLIELSPIEIYQKDDYYSLQFKLKNDNVQKLVLFESTSEENINKVIEFMKKQTSRYTTLGLPPQTLH